MTTSSSQSGNGEPRDKANWARPVSRLTVSEVAPGAVSINVEGRRVVGAFQGFGQMWQKTYRVRLSGTAFTPAEVITTWKEHFSSFWPSGSRFYAPLIGLAPGEVAVLSLGPSGVALSTGVLVIYADEESFTFMTPEGHMFAGWITFSANEEDGCAVAQVQVLIRANDPLWEIGMRVVGFKKEDEFWLQTLRNLAAHLGVHGQPQMHATCLDPKVRWSQAKNVWHNAAIRSGLYTLAAPLRWARKLVTRRA